MLEILREMGFSEYEAKVYLALLKLKKATAYQIEKKSGVPHPKVYEALRKLKRKGLIFVIGGRPMYFEVIPPEEGLKSYAKLKAEFYLNKAEEFVNNYKSIAHPISAEEKIRIFSGINNTFRQFNEDCEKVERELFLISRGESVPPRTYYYINKMVERGVDFRFIVFEYSEKNKEYVYDWARRYKGRVRYYPIGRFSMWIVDKKHLTLVVRNPSNEKDRVNIVFYDKDLAKAMHSFFLDIWKKAVVID